MAMVNYPYPTNFVNDLPAWPVNASCVAAGALNATNSTGYMQAIAAAANVFYNYTGSMQCLNISDSN
jgi:lysosomal Pro-X carboxypeptidase